MADFDLLLNLLSNITANSISDVVKDVTEPTKAVNHRGGKDFADDIFTKSFEHFIQMVPTDKDILDQMSKADLEQLLHKVSALAFLFGNDYVTKIRSAAVGDPKKAKAAHEHNMKYATSKTGKARKTARKK
jgi:hypothetical protein